MLVTTSASSERPRKEVSINGDVEAHLTYVVGKAKLGLPPVANIRLTVIRHGERVIDQRLIAPSCADCDLLPRKVTSPGSRSLVVGDLTGDTEPEVLIAFYTGGAHCCVVTHVYAYRGGTYKRSVHNWAEGYAKKRLDRNAVPEFLTGDNRFDYTFTAHAFSGEPLQVWNFGRGGFVNVTRRFRRAIAQDAAKWLRLYRRERSRPGSDVRGFLAPYLADKYHLGEQREAWNVLRTAHARRELGWRSDGWAVGSGYLRKLCRFLLRRDTPVRFATASTWPAWRSLSGCPFHVVTSPTPG